MFARYFEHGAGNGGGGSKQCKQQRNKAHVNPNTVSGQSQKLCGLRRHGKVASRDQPEVTFFESKRPACSPAWRMPWAATRAARANTPLHLYGNSHQPENAPAVKIPFLLLNLSSWTAQDLQFCASLLLDEKNTPHDRSFATFPAAPAAQRRMVAGGHTRRANPLYQPPLFSWVRTSPGRGFPAACPLERRQFHDPSGAVRHCRQASLRNRP